MNRYSKGKIYKIVDNTNSNVYYGSTIQTLPDRLAKHKYAKRCISRLIIDNGDYNIILVENYPCNSKKELETRERYFIENNECINERIPGRTTKEWYEDNRDKLLEYQKQYREKNKDKKKEYKKEYNRNNKEKIKEYNEKIRDKRIDYMTNIRRYHNSWGGRIDKNNNSLLKIDIDLFN